MRWKVRTCNDGKDLVVFEGLARAAIAIFLPHFFLAPLMHKQHHHTSCAQRNATNMLQRQDKLPNLLQQLQLVHALLHLTPLAVRF